ncbi:zinc ribbon domain-containing protein [Dactylosporangium salmoneum]|uniref:Cas12f1-like TNB domain-containing protein n=1 Tax=Dactylosporangium salmoneum TaxID=53361 RepID=A0ABN3GFC9_9ACTN
MPGEVETVRDTDLAPVRRTRGKSKTKNWRRDQDAPVAVIRLELDALDAQAHRRVEGMYEAAFRLRRALQAQARSRVDAYWAAHRLRAVDAKKARARFGLSRTSLETVAYQHVERADWMRHHLTKALAMHLADEVWEACDRHLFADKTGKRFGRPRAGRWFDFARIPGRARSHTQAKKWETFRLVGSLDAHATTYPPRQPESALTQPAVMPAPTKPRAGWWSYDGPLTVVFTGLPAGDLVLPVRLPQGAGQWSRLKHFLADPAVWHKIDLVRVQDRRAPDGWRYYAHLMVLAPGWTSPAVAADRAAAPRDRIAGVDGNVSNLAVVSMPLDSAEGALLATYVTVTPEQRAAAEQAALTARRRQRALDRSRRSSNAAQYAPSRRQANRAERRQRAGLTERTVGTPAGGRVSDAAGRPKRSYRKDQYSDTYRRVRADHAQDSRAATQAKRARARDVARQIVTTHGPHLVTEHVDMRTWARLWGKGIALFSPGMLVAALDREARAAGGRLLRAGTYRTALSQRCPCGHRAKKPLAQRTHRCERCGLVGDRDLVAAAMAACVRLSDPDDPSTARLDDPLVATLRQRVTTGQQEALARSTAPAPVPAHAGTGVGTAATHVVASARQTTLLTVCATPDETPTAASSDGTTRKHTDGQQERHPTSGAAGRVATPRDSALASSEP